MDYILIIGASSDIAKALARTYAENGYNVYLAGREAESLEVFANDLRIRTERDVRCFELNVLDEDSHEPFFRSLPVSPLGVVSVAGYLGDQATAQMDFSEAKNIINTNFTGIVSILNIAANHLEVRRNGFIIGMSSVAGDRGRKSNYIYGSSKAALTAFLSGLRNRLHNANIQVLTVKPGFVRTKMTKGMDLPPLLTAQPEEVATAIYRAQRKGKTVLYTKPIWRLIMLVIKAIPENIFKRLNL